MPGMILCRVKKTSNSALTCIDDGEARNFVNQKNAIAYYCHGVSLGATTATLEASSSICNVVDQGPREGDHESKIYLWTWCQNQDRYRSNINIMTCVQAEGYGLETFGAYTCIDRIVFPALGAEQLVE